MSVLLNVKVDGPVNITERVADVDCDTVKEALRKVCPHLNVYKSPIAGGLCVTASLDEKSTWANGIFENSRYFRAFLSVDGKMTWGSFVCGRTSTGWQNVKARACTVKTLDAFIAKVVQYVHTANEALPAAALK